MADETSAPPMSEFEERVLELLTSMDKRLKSIEATTEYFYEAHRRMLQNMSRPPWP